MSFVWNIEDSYPNKTGYLVVYFIPQKNWLQINGGRLVQKGDFVGA